FLSFSPLLSLPTTYSFAFPLYVFSHSLFFLILAHALSRLILPPFCPSRRSASALSLLLAKSARSEAEAVARRLQELAQQHPFLAAFSAAASAAALRLET